MARKTFSGKIKPLSGSIDQGPSKFDLLLSLGDDAFHGHRNVNIRITVGMPKQHCLYVDSLTKVNLQDDNWHEDGWDLGNIQRLKPEDPWSGRYWYFQGWTRCFGKDNDHEPQMVEGLYDHQCRNGFLM